MNTACSIRSAAMAASAGTGKTFALSSRYLALLAGGADPASIVALTFTRKAAGEILARIRRGWRRQPPAQRNSRI
ncbi:MAG TPA: UvrD-helicase domain-containing protein [Kiritimatiellia bacterium]|nr:UvrD-helicase domain-containing protein [Kiritimatiellia bacterium]